MSTGTSVSYLNLSTNRPAEWMSPPPAVVSIVLSAIRCCDNASGVLRSLRYFCYLLRRLWNRPSCDRPSALRSDPLRLIAGLHRGQARYLAPPARLLKSSESSSVGQWNQDEAHRKSEVTFHILDRFPPQVERKCGVCYIAVDGEPLYQRPPGTRYTRILAQLIVYLQLRQRDGHPDLKLILAKHTRSNVYLCLHILTVSHFIMAAALVDRVADLFKSNLDINASTPEVTSEKHAPVDVVEVVVEPPKQPDILYLPNEAKWKARTARRLAEDPSLPKTALPEGFPKKLESPLVWEGKDWTDAAQWEYKLSAEQLKEIDDALKHFKGQNKPLGYLSPSTFPLPTLGPILKDLSHELHTGRGFFVVKTIPVDAYTREENTIIYAGVSSYVGPLRGVQDLDGVSVVGHIKDLTQTHPLKSIGFPAWTTDKQVFHTDAGDIISLYVLETAEEGGVSRIGSSWRVYNELAETRPDLIKTLAEPWPLDGFGGKPAYTTRPLLFHVDNKIIIQYARRLFTSFPSMPRSEGIPPITEAQAEALDAIHFLAEKHALGLSFEKGDIQYINNLSVFHARDAFRDTPEHKRHLLRLWLRDEEKAWKLPSELEPQWKKIYYSSTPDTEYFPLEPEPRGLSTLEKTKETDENSENK
ncbi:unnamed protein product [Cyclocybe aegerita]|uniref:TauD/TfdA-like domain-containing protein n=1 Tax=Cyclocybe aegerita TaxID=1973307 RepID=A0A8S0VU85_CYCAE|nr:unnamed protein product [Cyclocybe aegerita]